jgi:hypothetical protein
MSEGNRVLLVWDDGGQSVQLYLLEGRCAELAIAAHGLYVNSDESEALDELNRELADIEPLAWNEPVETGGNAKVALCGFLP